MKKKNAIVKRIGAGIAAAVCITVISTAGVENVYGAAVKNVAVTVPSFRITLNETNVDNSHRQYPLLAYKGITYFPLTYSDTRFLGVESHWDEASRKLTVKKSDISGGYNAQWRKSANGRSYTARICDFSVEINGTAVDNSKEEYPLLTFRNMTYFPMTWEYGVDRFGWDYSFDNKAGFSVASVNPRAVELNIPVAANPGYDSEWAGKTGDFGYAALVMGDMVYYRGKGNAIYQSPLANPAEAKKIHDLPDPNWDASPPYLSIKDGKPQLYYRVGGATMGHDEIWSFERDGSSQRVDINLGQNAVWGEGFRLYTYTGMYSSNGNLYWQSQGQEGICIGDEAIYYRGTPVLYGGKAYIAGSESTKGPGNIPGDIGGLYEVDLATKETRRIKDISLPSGVGSFDLSSVEDGHILYLVGTVWNDTSQSECGLYRVDLSKENLDASHIQLVTKLNPANPSHAFCGGELYYVAGEDYDHQTLYKLGSSEPINPNGCLTYLYNDGGYVIAGFRETEMTDTRLMVFDETGRVVYRSADVVQLPQIDGNRLFYVTEDGRSYLVQLKPSAVATTKNEEVNSGIVSNNIEGETDDITPEELKKIFHHQDELAALIQKTNGKLEKVLVVYAHDPKAYSVALFPSKYSDGYFTQEEIGNMRKIVLDNAYTDGINKDQIVIVNGETGQAYSI